MRARKLLFRAVTDQLAAAELSRFFAPEVAGRIRDSDIALEPGQAELREAAILMVDLRGFTPLSHALAPGEVMALLSEYQSRVVAAVTAPRRQHRQVHGRRHPRELRRDPAERQPSPPMRCARSRMLLAATARWAEERRAAGLPAPRGRAPRSRPGR